MRRYLCAVMAVLLLLLCTACNSREVTPVDDDFSATLPTETPDPGSDAASGPVKITENYADAQTVGTPTPVPTASEAPDDASDAFGEPGAAGVGGAGGASTPTTAPTEAPTASPEPTTAVTQAPSPSAVPSQAPVTATQTQAPTAAPAPTQTPTQTPAPTARATQAPSATATSRPTPGIQIVPDVPGSFPTPPTWDIPLVPLAVAVGLLLLCAAGALMLRRI